MVYLCCLLNNLQEVVILNYLLFTFSIVLVIYLLSFINSKSVDFSFLTKKHTTLVKGLAILLVVLTHMGGRFGIRYLTPLGGIGVAMFLICSGFGLNESYKTNGLSNYWGKKIKSVWIPYFIIQAIYLTFSLFANPIPLSVFLKDIFLINPAHPFGWYMQILFFWYIVFYLLNRFNFLEHKQTTLFLLVISVSFIFLGNELWAEQALSFASGVYLSELKTNGKYTSKFYGNKIVTLSLISVGIIFLFIKQFDATRELPYFILNTIQLLIKFPIAVALIVFIIQFPLLFRTNFFLILGDNAFPIYLIHAYTILFLGVPTFKNVVIFLLLTPISAIIFNLCLKGIKIRKLFFLN